MDQDFRPNFPGKQQYHDNHNDYSYHRQHEGEPIFSHQHNQMNAERNNSFGGNCGAGGYGYGGRRGDAKLYAQPVSRKATEEDLLSIFGEHGHVTEVILPRDKQTGEQHAYCFVKYATFEEANRAVNALNNCVTFPGESANLQVKFAAYDKEYRGPPQDKLYVRGFTKNNTCKELEEAFFPYGHIEDIYILRDQFKEIRGVAFVQYSRREMAAAAVKALNGIYFMRNCDQPLTVKFADPLKKPRNGQIRCMPNIQNPMPRYASPNGPYPVQHHPSNFQGQGGPYWGSFVGAAPNVPQLPHPCVHQAPIRATQFPPQQIQIQQGNCQSPQQSVCEIQKQLPPSPSLHNLGPDSDSLPANIEAGTSEMRTDPSAASKAPGSPENVASLECDWSEHTCPDGYKYYYNCVTCESSWDKPEELTIFELQLKRRKAMQNPSQNIQSCVQTHSVEQV